MPYFNEDLLAKSGISAPTNDWTMDDLRELAGRVSRDTSGDGNMDIWGLWARWTRPFDLMPWLFSAGNTFLSEDYSRSTVNEPTARDAFELIQELITLGAAPNPEQMDPGTAEDEFVAGRLGVIYRPTSQIAKFTSPDTNIAFRIGMVNVPKWVRQETVLGADGFGITASTGDLDAAAKFLEFLTSAEYHRAYIKGTDVTFTAHRDATLERDPEWGPHVYSSLSYARVLPTIRDISQLYAGVEEIMGAIVDGDMAPGVATALLHQQIEVALESQ